MGIKRRSNTFLSDFSSSSFSIFIHPSFPHLSSYYIQPPPPPQKKKITYTPPLRYLPVLSCSYPSQRYQQELHRLTAHRLKPNLSHTHCLAALPSTPTPAFVTDLLQPFKRSNMPSTQTLHAPSHPSLPLAMSGKSPYYSPPMAHQVPYARPIISTPTPGSSVNTSAVPSLTSGSQSGEDNVPHGASGIDLVEMLNDRLSNAVDTLPLDRSLVRQAQT